MTKLRKTFKRTSLGFCVLDFPDLRFIRAERLFRILRPTQDRFSIFGFRIFLACVLCAKEVLRVPFDVAQDMLRVLRGEIISILGLATALWLSGCLLGPDYKRPSVEIPPQFRAAMTPEALPSIADLKWFEVFRDEHLQELIRVALVQNYDLRDAIARVDQARANLGITQADQYPNFGAGGGFTSIELSREGAFSIPNGNRRRDFGTVFLSLFSYEIDIWGRLRRATEAAQAELLASDWNRKAVITTLVSDVATAYFNLLELDQELSIAKDTLTTREESLRLIRRQLQGGVGTLLDVRQGEQLVYGAAETIPSAEQQIEQTENQISLLLGKNPGSVVRGSLTAQQ